MSAGGDTVGEHRVVLGGGSVRLRFRQYRDGFVLDRDYVERDGTTFTQTLPFSSRRVLRAFLIADPHYEKFAAFVHGWMDEFLPRR